MLYYEVKIKGRDCDSVLVNELGQATDAWGNGEPGVPESIKRLAEEDFDSDVYPVVIDDEEEDVKEDFQNHFHYEPSPGCYWTAKIDDLSDVYMEETQEGWDVYVRRPGRKKPFMSCKTFTKARREAVLLLRGDHPLGANIAMGDDENEEGGVPFRPVDKFDEIFRPVEGEPRFEAVLDNGRTIAIEADGASADTWNVFLLCYGMVVQTAMGLDWPVALDRAVDAFDHSQADAAESVSQVSQTFHVPDDPFADILVAAGVPRDALNDVDEMRRYLLDAMRKLDRARTTLKLVMPLAESRAEDIAQQVERSEQCMESMRDEPGVPDTGRLRESIEDGKHRLRQFEAAETACRELGVERPGRK